MSLFIFYYIRANLPDSGAHKSGPWLALYLVSFLDSYPAPPIRRAKCTCWEIFLEGATDHPGPGGTARCWQALKYTKFRTTTTSPTLHGPQGQLTSSSEEEEALIREIASPQTPEINQEGEADTSPGSWHGHINEGIVKHALFHQAVQKAPGIDRLSFWALRLLWEWDSPRIITLAQ